MTEELFAYLMDDLSADARAQVEQKLAIDPAWRKELKRLQECLAASAEPCQCLEEPPADLVERTCCLVEKISDHPCEPSQPKRPRLAAFSAAARCTGRRAYSLSLADMTVGVGVLLLVAALVTPALFETRAASRQATCESNLRAFGAALFNYQEAHNQQLPPVEPGESAGMYALRLVESGVLTRGQLREILVCPESQLADDLFAGRVALTIPRRNELQLASDVQRQRLLKHIGGSYAYRLGYTDRNGAYEQVPFTGDSRSLLMGDAPYVSPAGIRSGSHAGRGLNTIDQSMATRFQSECLLNGDNVYTNDDGEQAAGLTPHDTVLGSSEVGPNGPVPQIALPR
jgi:hypothetical protein